MDSMKYLVFSLLIMSFIGIGIFGSALFGMEFNHSGECLTVTVNGMACPTTITAFVTHHISALQSFTRTVVPPLSQLLFLLTSLLLASVSIFFVSKDLCCLKLGFSRERLRVLSLHSFYSWKKIISWLSLFELSPSVQ